MRFAVRFLRFRGRVIPWREVVNRVPAIGDVRIEETRDDELRRYVRTAKLFPERCGVFHHATCPELFECRVIAMSEQAFTLNGLERIEHVDYAQSWLISAP